MNKTTLRRTVAAAFGLLLAGSQALAQQQQPPRPLDLLANPDFVSVTENFSAAQTLELAAHFNMSLRQYQQAIPMYEALLKASPNRADLWIMLAAGYNRINDAREAFEAADIAITLEEFSSHFYAERGVAAFRLGRYDSSIGDLKRFVKAFPVNARSHYYLGLAQAATGDGDAARASLLKARALNPKLALLVEYYLGLLAAERGNLSLSRELLDRTNVAFEGSDLPISTLVAGQLRSLDGEVARRMRAALHESDVRFAPQPAAAASR
jgi:tetratricopeptide (TPR) repeat protein